MDENVLPMLKLTRSVATSIGSTSPTAIAVTSQSSSPQSTRWCFTLNNPPDQWWQNSTRCLNDSTVAAKGIKYFVAGREVAPTTATPHAQGFVIFVSPKRRTAVLSLLDISGAHLEPARGTSVQAADYCKKDGTFLECGSLPKERAEAGQRERLRWDEALVNAQEGNFELIHPQIQIMQYQNLRRIAIDHSPLVPTLTWAATQQPNQWYWGGSGKGKSRMARNTFPDAYPKMCNKWWDHYTGQPFVLIDDFDKSHSVLGHHLKIWADRYPFIAEVKGLVTKNVRPHVIIVTSQYAMEDIWVESPETVEALRRRFKVTHFS